MTSEQRTASGTGQSSDSQMEREQPDGEQDIVNRGDDENDGAGELDDSVELEEDEDSKD